jgi:hypothetical protein
MDAAKIPGSNCENAGKETCSGAPNHGNVTEAAPLVDAGIMAGCGHWEGDGTDIKFVKD